MIKIMDLPKKLDYKLDTIDERIGLLHEILNTEFVGEWEFPDEAIMDIIEQTENEGIDTSTIKACINKDDPLYSDSILSKILEVLGSYILNCKEVKEKYKEPGIKVYHTKELFQRALKEEKLLSELLPYSEENVCMDIFVQQKNYKKDKRIQLTNEYYQKYPLVKCYADLKAQMTKRIKASWYTPLSKYEVGRINMMKHIAHSAGQDLQLALEHCLQPIKFKQPLRDEGSPNWDIFDLADKHTIITLLPIAKTDDINSGLNTLLLDLDGLLKRTKMTKKQRQIITLRRMGMRDFEVARRLGIKNQSVNSSVHSVCQKAANRYLAELDTVYYRYNHGNDTFRCSRCGKIHPIDKIHPRYSESHIHICKDCAKRYRKPKPF